MKNDSPSAAGASRRDVLLGGLIATVAAGLAGAALAQTDQGQNLLSSTRAKEQQR